MTIYTIIEKIYDIYATYQLDDISFDEMERKIIGEISQKWPDIEIGVGISFEFDGLHFNVLLSNDLQEEFYKKYPEALI